MRKEKHKTDGPRTWAVHGLRPITDVKCESPSLKETVQTKYYLPRWAFFLFLLFLKIYIYIYIYTPISLNFVKFTQPNHLVGADLDDNH